jgi:hypothetical protein
MSNPTASARRIAAHVIETLPSQFDQRISLLAALEDLLPLDSGERSSVMLMRAQHESIRALQTTLPFQFMENAVVGDRGQNGKPAKGGKP